jgi:bcr-type benzoyl-CoA reductase subunit C
LALTVEPGIIEKSPMNPMDTFVDAASRIDPPMVREWKASGKPVVGTTCSYVPSEVFHAAGILPVRLRGLSAKGSEVSDAYFGPFICSFPKCLLQLAGNRSFNFMDGAVITAGCDAMRRLDECWRKAGEDIAGIVPPFFHYFDVPHKAEGHGLAWFVDEIRKLMDVVSSHFKVAITDDALCRSIEIYNEGRELFGALEALRESEEVRVTGTEAFAAAIARAILPPEAYIRLLATFLAEGKSRSPKKDDRVRLVLAGSVDDTLDLIRMIEDTGRAVVVADTLCFGARYGGDLVETGTDPVTALAAHYLAGSVCPRMFGMYNTRLQRLKDLVRRRGADGVVLQNIRFCDMHGSENGLFARDLAKSGIPALRMEREYGPIADTGRIRLRIDAFLEQIAATRQGTREGRPNLGLKDQDSIIMNVMG